MTTRSTLLVWLAVVVVGVAGCDTSEPLPPGVTTTTTRPPPPPPPTVEEVQEVDKCDDLVEVGVLFIENMIQALELSPSIGVLTGEDEPPEEIAFLQDVGRELDARVARLGCSVSQLNTEIAAEVEAIESNDPVVALFLEIVRSGVISLLPDSPATTPET